MNQTILRQEVGPKNKQIQLKSTVNPINCKVCGKGPENGNSITAKSLGIRTLFLCDSHYY